MSATQSSPATGAEATLRIGEVARRVGTTPRTIRYYEEIGLLPAEGDRESGRHRLYGERDVERLRDALRLKELLGVSLDELRELLEAEEARAALRDEWHHGEPDAGRRCEILTASLGYLDRQLALVRRRRDEIAALEGDLSARRRRVLRRRRELQDL
jgi:DNA-binding transcriptional MerR regulator